MTVLAFDTAGPVIGVGLWTGDRALVRTERVRRGAEARLVPWAQELCAEAGLALDQVTGIGVAHGPGAFTGVRVGIATAVGLSMGLGCPLWTGSSLESRALRLGGEGRVLALLDARKSRVYAALYDGTALVEGPADIDPEAAARWGAGAVATGEGALVYQEKVVAAGGRVAADADDPAVGVLARLAAAGLAAGEGIDPASVEPLYLRDADAKKPKR